MEKDLLETIIALPDQLFYNTGINTYLWFLTNRKSEDRKGKVQLIDGRKYFQKMRKSLGSKRHEIGEDDKQKILELYQEFKESTKSKIFDITEFGYRQITIERPLRLNFQASPERIEILKTSPAFLKLSPKVQDELIKSLSDFPNKKLFLDREEFLGVFNPHIRSLKLGGPVRKAVLEALSEQDDKANICKDSEGNIESDAKLRDTENVPLGTDIHEYFEKEVKPYVPDAWINETVRDHKDNQVGKVGYEIPFTRYFYKYTPPRSLEEIETDIEKTENELLELLKQL